MAETKTKNSKDKTNKKSPYIWASGRRKTSVARIRIKQEGGGEITVNDMPIEEYFPNSFDREKVIEPFKETGRNEQGFDVSIKVQGGGKKAQVEAARLGIARALVSVDEDLRKILRKKDLLTRDPRMKERKKYGLHKARRAHQFSKR